MTSRWITVVGARPQFIKAAIVSAAFRRAGIEEELVHTGQHYDAKMSDVFFAELGLPAPSHHLGIGGLSHGAMTGRTLEAIEKVLLTSKPDGVVVFGDTNATLAGALAAVKLGIPVAHIEAGMRSFNRKMPEEINRVLTDHVATKHFVTSEAPKRLLEAEGITKGIEVVGDVMLDAVNLYAEAAEKQSLRAKLGLADRGYALATLHRAENTDDKARLTAIAKALANVAKRTPVVLPLHPRTRAALASVGLEMDARVRIIDPVSYLEMLDLERHCVLVLTDSGGVQKEAYFARVPCVTLRDETEWTETVELGWNAIAGADTARIEELALRALESPPKGEQPAIYGDGRAADRIAASLFAMGTAP